jgi:ribose/xylose/arabinose/galactoside ABC-type transport system permease subunit
MKYLKKTVITLLFPVLMFCVMLLVTACNPKCYVNGKFIFLHVDLVRYVILTACMTICAALAIWIQLKNGRFDFSGGASMILTAIIAGTIGYEMNNPMLAMVMAIAIGIGLSCLTGIVYIVGRIPIIICTIGMTLLYESMTYLVCGGDGINNYFQYPTLSLFGRMPMVFIPTMIAIAAFVIFDRFSAAGRKGKILANNQIAGVNIGINEKKNIMISYVFTGIIIGMAAVIYVSQRAIAPQSGLATSGILFSYIVPVFIGMFIGMASMDVIGIVMASIGMAILNYGLNCMNLGAGGWLQIIMGLFVMCFYAFQAQLGNIIRLADKFSRKKTAYSRAAKPQMEKK